MHILLGNITGQFKPGPEARPAIGTSGLLEFADEDRVEVVVNDKGQREDVKKVVEKLKTVSFLAIQRFCNAIVSGTSLRRGCLRCIQA
jgi:hypothetical protein